MSHICTFYLQLLLLLFLQLSNITKSFDFGSLLSSVFVLKPKRSLNDSWAMCATGQKAQCKEATDQRIQYFKNWRHWCHFCKKKLCVKNKKKIVKYFFFSLTINKNYGFFSDDLLIDFIAINKKCVIWIGSLIAASMSA